MCTIMKQLMNTLPEPALVISPFSPHIHRDLNDFLYKKSGTKIPHWEMKQIEINYFKTLNSKMMEKSAKRIDEIKKRITNDISKNNYTKKYQINGFLEFKNLENFVKNLNLNNHELLWCHDNKIEKNKLDKIIEGDYFCCRDCDKPMKFINKKVKVMYCYFYKNTPKSFF